MQVTQHLTDYWMKLKRFRGEKNGENASLNTVILLIAGCNDNCLSNVCINLRSSKYPCNDFQFKLPSTVYFVVTVYSILS